MRRHAPTQPGAPGVAELAELGLDDSGEAILIVEWPERAGEGAWPEALRLTLEFAAAGVEIASPPVK